MIEERMIATAAHGRYLIAAPALDTPHPAPVLVGFHGYAEDAALQLERLRGVPGSDRWLIVSIQGLHRFYRGRTEEVVASWMTRQDRELMIADNVAYVSHVLDDVARERRVSSTLVFSGFSQGVAMAFRAAALGHHPASAVLALGGDVPPDLSTDALARIPAALLGRGERDQWYSAGTQGRDETRLRASGVAVTTCVCDGGHEWTDVFSRAAAEFLGRLE
jgi:predicted esterase